MIYDAGTVFGRGQRPTHRHLDESVMRRELDVIRDELHATHVRVAGRHPDRLDTAAAAVAEAGLGLWYSPAVFDYDPAEPPVGPSPSPAAPRHSEGAWERRSASSPPAKRPCSCGGSYPAKVSPAASRTSRPTRRCSEAAT